ncbi:monooxygenase [Frondihabitans sucicola]|uniref:Monooxygenase n=1 Tax=Frondihabitans sucicola TaxID=1268041 RepID=A0ABM8GS71_9MICO|nr:NtaA/DmoA family FMN-dependent monooxygenase [Frondihabitans sucicola]BDZ51317.1 monooxygenase [Frondihabitans sucicola]
MSRRMLLGAFVFHPGGAHVTGWRQPTSRPAEHLSIKHFRHFAQTAERGVFDTIFLADGLYFWDRYPSGVDHYGALRPEPFTLLSALSQVTEHIGLAATVSTTYNEPYHVARTLASLDHLSRGRAAWNLVTSRYDEEAKNFGGDSHLDHTRRYERGREFVDVVNGLLDSWDDDAIVADAESGIFADREKLHTLNHRGEFFDVRGPLNIARPPQGHPVLFQAGGSESGLELAAATADAVFARGGSLADSQAFYADLKARTERAGRDRDRLSILPSVMPVVGETREAARAEAEAILALTPDALILEAVSHTIGQDLAGRSADERFDYARDFDTSNETRSRSAVLDRLIAEGSATAREVYAWSFAQNTLTGTAADIADHLEERFENGAADGFVVQFPHLPGGIDAFVDDVIPELQRRGLTRTSYEEATLRERFGLERPARITA